MYLILFLVKFVDLFMFSGASNITSMDSELTIYGTPAQDTPFTTPISTPRRVPYRMNPVKMIRQHVPVQILSTEEERIASPDSGN